MERQADFNSTRSATPAWRVLATPWLDLTQPRVAAVNLVAASSRGFWFCFVIHAVALATLVVLLFLWDDTVRVNRPARPPAAAVPTSGPAVRPGVPAPQLYERGIAEVWCDWHGDVLLGPTELLFFLVVVLTAACCAGLAWLNLPFVYRSGSVLESCECAFRATTACLGLVIVLVGSFGWAIVAARHWGALERTAVRAAPNLFFDLGGLALVLSPAAACLVIWWVGRAVRGVQAMAREPELAPVCEGCGYDLTHQPAAGRCSECGFSVAASLSGDRRPGSAWERRASMTSWLATTWRVLFRPSGFYAGLKMKTSPRGARGFAGWHYVLLGPGGAAWIMLVYFVGTARGRFREPLEEALAYAAVFLFATPIVCWVGHRLIAAAVFTWWLARKELRDCGWAVKVVAYETAFLWAFCLFWGSLVGSLIALDQDWIVDLVGDRLKYVFGMPIGFVVLLVGTAALGVVWVWRYLVAGRAIRWSNF